MSGVSISARFIRRGFVVTLVLLGVMLLVLQAGLLLSFGAVPPILARTELVDPEAQFSNWLRMEAVKQEIAVQKFAASDLIVAIGFSTAREGFDPGLVAAAGGKQLRLLNLATSGGSFGEMLAYFGEVSDAPVAGSRLVLAVHPCWLGGRLLRSAPPSFGKVLDKLHHETPKVALRAAYDWLTDNLWTVGNKVGLNYAVKRQLLSGRRLVGAWAGIRPAALAPSPGFDAWRTERLYQGSHADDAVLAEQMRHWESAGWFESQSYRPDSAEAQALERLLERLQVSGVQVTVVLMPESSALRTRVPPAAERILRLGVARALGAIQVVDLRAALPDSEFYDHAHVNAAGRVRLSRALGEHLALAAVPLSE